MFLKCSSPFEQFGLLSHVLSSPSNGSLVFIKPPFQRLAPFSNGSLFGGLFLYLKSASPFERLAHVSQMPESLSSSLLLDLCIILRYLCFLALSLSLFVPFRSHVSRNGFPCPSFWVVCVCLLGVICVSFLPLSVSFSYSLF